MPIIAEGWEVYDYYSKTFMCYSKMKHLLRCVVCSKEMEKGHERDSFYSEPMMTLLLCGHVVCQWSMNECLKTLRNNVESAALAEDIHVVDDATKLSGKTTVESGTYTTVLAADTTATRGLETTADPGPSTAVSETNEEREDTKSGLRGETSPTVSADDEELRDTGSGLSGDSSATPDSYTKFSTYTCTTCDLVTTEQEILSLRAYMQCVIILYGMLEYVLRKGSPLDIECNACRHIHKESDGGVFAEDVKVCTHCVPTHFFCKGVCAEDHGEKTCHNLESYSPPSHEWRAMITRAAWIFPHTYRQLAKLRNRDESILLDDSLFPCVLEDYREVIKDIQWNISLFCRMTECQKETVDKLPELYPALSSASKKTLAEDYYSCTEKVPTIEGEIIKFGVLYRKTAHLIFLEAIVNILPECLGWWKVVIRKHLCLANLMEYCFPLWRIPLTNDFVMPCTNLVSHHPLQLNLQEVFDQAERMPGSNVAQTEKMQKSFVKVSMQIYLRPGIWQDKGTKTFTYQKSKNKHPDGSGFRKSVQIADNLYAVSSDSKLFLVRKMVHSTLISYGFSPTKAERFGDGLWWNGRYLFATCIGTKNIARWDFKTTKDTFIVRYSLHTINSNVAFAESDTIVEVSDRLCICYDKSIPGREIPRYKTLQCFEFTTGIDLNDEFPRVIFQPPPVIQAPWLISASGSLPYVILRDDDQRNMPTLFVFSDFASMESSWCALQFHFPRADSARRKVVKDVWFVNENTLCLSLKINDANPEIEASNEEVHINLTEPAEHVTPINGFRRRHHRR